MDEAAIDADFRRQPLQARLAGEVGLYDIELELGTEPSDCPAAHNASEGLTRRSNREAFSAQSGGPL